MKKLAIICSIFLPVQLITFMLFGAISMSYAFDIKSNLLTETLLGNLNDEFLFLLCLITIIGGFVDLIMFLEIMRFSRWFKNMDASLMQLSDEKNKYLYKRKAYENALEKEFNQSEKNLMGE
jgi:hypothetical protein